MKNLELGLSQQERDERSRQQDEQRRTRNNLIAIGVLVVLLFVLDGAILTNLSLIQK